MPATLLVAAHGTRSERGSATTRDLVDAVAATRPDVPVAVCFLDVAAPSLPDALASLSDVDVVVVPLLLSAGYHVETDIPSAVLGYPRVRVAAHLGPDPAIVAAVAERLESARGDAVAATTALAAIASSRAGARAEVATAAALLASRLGRPVEVLALSADPALDLAALRGPVEVATYLLADGGFLDALRAAGPVVVGDPIGVHSALVGLIWARYDAALGQSVAR